MIRIIAITDDRRIVHLTSLDKLADYNVIWYWADFLSPSPEEVHLLGEGYFHFHPLTIEDCLVSTSNVRKWTITTTCIFSCCMP